MAMACMDLTTGERLTYRALSARVEQCASALAASVDGLSGARVAIIARNCIETAILTARASGAARSLSPQLAAGTSNWRRCLKTERRPSS